MFKKGHANNAAREDIRRRRAQTVPRPGTYTVTMEDDPRYALILAVTENGAAVIEQRKMAPGDTLLPQDQSGDAMDIFNQAQSVGDTQVEIHDLLEYVNQLGFDSQSVNSMYENLVGISQE